MSYTSSPAEGMTTEENVSHLPQLEPDDLTLLDHVIRETDRNWNQRGNDWEGRWVEFLMYTYDRETENLPNNRAIFHYVNRIATIHEEGMTGWDCLMKVVEEENMELDKLSSIAPSIAAVEDFAPVGKDPTVTVARGDTMKHRPEHSRQAYDRHYSEDDDIEIPPETEEQLMQQVREARVDAFFEIWNLKARMIAIREERCRSVAEHYFRTLQTKARRHKQMVRDVQVQRSVEKLWTVVNENYSRTKDLEERVELVREYRHTIEPFQTWRLKTLHAAYKGARRLHKSNEATRTIEFVAARATWERDILQYARTELENSKTDSAINTVRSAAQNQDKLEGLVPIAQEQAVLEHVAFYFNKWRTITRQHMAKERMALDLRAERRLRLGIEAFQRWGNKTHVQDMEDTAQNITVEPVLQEAHEETVIENETLRPIDPQTPRRIPSTTRAGKTAVLPFRTPRTAPPALYAAASPPRTARRRGHGLLFTDPKFYPQLQAILPDHQLLSGWKRTKSS